MLDNLTILDKYPDFIEDKTEKIIEDNNDLFKKDIVMIDLNKYKDIIKSFLYSFL